MFLGIFNLLLTSDHAVFTSFKARRVSKFFNLARVGMFLTLWALNGLVLVSIVKLPN